MLRPWLVFPGWLLLAALLVGCASTVPPSIRVAEPEALSLEQARARGEEAIGAGVRWGGRVLGVENRADETWVEVLALPLGWEGEPKTDSKALGRFLARVSGFLDPAVYAPDRRITVSGALDAPVTRPVGRFPYVYPVVRVREQYLREEPPPREPRDPWCDPWGPGFHEYPWGRPGPWPYCW